MRGFCVDRTGQIEWSIQLDQLPELYQGWPPENRDPTRRAPGAVRLERMLHQYLARHHLPADITDVYHQAQHPDRGYLRLRLREQAVAALLQEGELMAQRLFRWALALLPLLARIPLKTSERELRGR